MAMEVRTTSCKSCESEVDVGGKTSALSLNMEAYMNDFDTL